MYLRPNVSKFLLIFLPNSVDPSFVSGEHPPVPTLLRSGQSGAGRMRWDRLCFVKW